LDKFPVVKQFIFNSGGLDEYPSCRLKVIRGRDPDLLLVSSDGEEQRFDLTQFTTHESLHQLFASNGLARGPRVQPVDTGCYQSEREVFARCGPRYAASCGDNRCCSTSGYCSACIDGVRAQQPTFSNSNNICASSTTNRRLEASESDSTASSPVLPPVPSPSSSPRTTLANCLQHESVVGSRCGASFKSTCGAGRCCSTSGWCATCVDGVRPQQPRYSNGNNLCHDEL